MRAGLFFPNFDVLVARDGFFAFWLLLVCRADLDKIGLWRQLLPLRVRPVWRHSNSGRCLEISGSDKGLWNCPRTHSSFGARGVPPICHPPSCWVIVRAFTVYSTERVRWFWKRRSQPIRIALCATRAHIVGLVLREGLSLVSAGLALGLAAVLVLTRLLSSSLYGFSAVDPVTFSTAPALLLLATLAACPHPGQAGYAFRSDRCPSVRITDSPRAFVEDKPNSQYDFGLNE